MTIYPINDTLIGFRFQSFRFLPNVTFTFMYLHCRTYTCVISETAGNCDQTCLDPTAAQAGLVSRRRRDTSDDEPPYVAVVAPPVPPVTASRLIASAADKSAVGISGQNVIVGGAIREVSSNPFTVITADFEPQGSVTSRLVSTTMTSRRGNNAGEIYYIRLSSQ